MSELHPQAPAGAPGGTGGQWVIKDGKRVPAGQVEVTPESFDGQTQLTNKNAVPRQMASKAVGMVAMRKIGDDTVYAWTEEANNYGEKTYHVTGCTVYADGYIGQNVPVEEVDDPIDGVEMSQNVLSELPEAPRRPLGYMPHVNDPTWEELIEQSRRDGYGGYYSGSDYDGEDYDYDPDVADREADRHEDYVMNNSIYER